MKYLKSLIVILFLLSNLTIQSVAQNRNRDIHQFDLTSNTASFRQHLIDSIVNEFSSDRRTLLVVKGSPDFNISDILDKADSDLDDLKCYSFGPYHQLDLTSEISDISTQQIISRTISRFAPTELYLINTNSPYINSTKVVYHTEDINQQIQISVASVISCTNNKSIEIHTDIIDSEGEYITSCNTSLIKDLDNERILAEQLLTLPRLGKYRIIQTLYYIPAIERNKSYNNAPARKYLCEKFMTDIEVIPSEIPAVWFNPVGNTFNYKGDKIRRISLEAGESTLKDNMFLHYVWVSPIDGTPEFKISKGGKIIEYIYSQGNELMGIVIASESDKKIKIKASAKGHKKGKLIIDHKI